jgi:hypothetical protein
VYEGRVNRLDVSEIGKPIRTPQGFLRVPATPTRAGIFSYRRADGTTRRELRPESEVFHADSLSSLSGAPLTDLHPREMVSPKNVRTLAIGHVGDSVRRDGQRVAAEITIEDDAAISAVERRDRVELSCGYACELDETPGTHEGQRYDAVQRKIRYNHVALLPRGAGRGGPDVALRLDSGDAMLEAPFTETVQQRQDSGDLMDPKDLINVRIDGLDLSVPKTGAQFVEKAIKDRDEKIGALTKERDTLQGRFDAASKELEDTKKKLTEASDTKRLDALIAERVTLLEAARRVLPAEHKYDGQTTRQVQEAALLKLDSKLDLTGKSDEYVAARFDAAIAALPSGSSTSRTDSLAAARSATVRPPAAPPPAHREDAKPYVPDWQKPLSVTRD